MRLDDEAKGRDLVIKGRVLSREYYGLFIKYTIDIGHQTIRAVEKNDGIHFHGEGEELPVGISRADLMSYDEQGKAVNLS